MRTIQIVQSLAIYYRWWLWW